MSSDDVNGPSTSASSPSTSSATTKVEPQEVAAEEKPSTMGQPKKPVPPWLKKYIIKQRKLKEEEEAQHSLLCEKHRERSEQQKQHSLTLEQTREQISGLEERLKKLRNEKHQLFAELKKVLNKEKKAESEQSPLAEARARVLAFTTGSESSATMPSSSSLSTSSSTLKRPYSPSSVHHTPSAGPMIPSPVAAAVLNRHSTTSNYHHHPSSQSHASAAATAYFNSVSAAGATLDAALDSSQRQPVATGPDAKFTFGSTHHLAPSLYSHYRGLMAASLNSTANAVSHHHAMAVDRHFLSAYAANPTAAAAAKALTASQFSRYGTIANPPEPKKPAHDHPARQVTLPMISGLPAQVNSREPSSAQHHPVSGYAPLDKRRNAPPYLPPRTPYDTFF